MIILFYAIAAKLYIHLISPSPPYTTTHPPKKKPKMFRPKILKIYHLSYRPIRCRYTDDPSCEAKKTLTKFNYIH